MTCFSIQKSPLFLLLAALLLAAPAGAQDVSGTEQEKILASGRVEAPIVIELFTAADCSACVLADRMLYDAIQDKNVIALSCKVADGSFLSDKKSREEQTGPMDPCVFRQWTYRNNNSTRDVSVTLPQIIMNGDDFLSGNTMSRFYNRVENYHYAYVNKALEVMARWKDQDTISINLPAAPSVRRDRKGSVWIIRYKDMEVEKITEGVNAGRVLRFSNIVKDIRHVGKWHGTPRTIEVDVPKPQGGKERGGYAIVVQELMGSPILAAGKLEDYPLPNDIKRDTPKAQ